MAQLSPEELYGARANEILASIPDYMPPGEATGLAMPKEILLFGDSLLELSSDPLLTFPLSAALVHTFRRRADVVCRALSGYTSRWLSHTPLERVEKELNDKELFMAVLLLGTNDSILPGFPHHVPVEEFERNLRKILDSVIGTIKSESTGKPLIVLATPPPCSLKQLANSKMSDSGKSRSNKAVEQYVSSIHKVAQESYSEGPAIVQVLDLYKIFTEISKSSPIENFLLDGLHFNGEGYKVLYVEIMDIVKKLGSQLRPIPMVEPHFSALI